MGLVEIIPSEYSALINRIWFCIKTWRSANKLISQEIVIQVNSVQQQTKTANYF